MNDLIKEALLAQKHAYAPYSGYSVGAAVLNQDGQIWSGCNVENVSYGLSICAERVALCKMVSVGCLSFREIVVATRDGNTPCGACLQFMFEMSTNPAQVRVITYNITTLEHQSFALSALLPYGFKTELKK